jgi:hypothetical protein
VPVFNFSPFRVAFSGAPNSGGGSHKMWGLSNSHGVPGVPGEEICFKTPPNIFSEMITVGKSHTFQDYRAVFDIDRRALNLVLSDITSFHSFPDFCR